MDKKDTLELFDKLIQETKDMSQEEFDSKTRILTQTITECLECPHAGMYYTDCVSMHYRNKCEHKDANHVHIYDGKEIPDSCPLPCV